MQGLKVLATIADDTFSRIIKGNNNKGINPYYCLTATPHQY